MKSPGGGDYSGAQGEERSGGSSGNAPFGPPRRILLVGFMGSGKTTVGRILSDLLGWSFLDFDTEIEKRAGLPIWEIFRQHGEAFFRDLEGKIGAELLLLPEVVLASGGGWPVTEGRMDNLDAGTIAVWLQVPLRVALDRAGAEGPTRPLLDVSDSLVEAETLLRRREPFYRKAQLTIDSTTADPQGLAEQIYYLVNEKGWASSHLPPPYK